MNFFSQRIIVMIVAVLFGSFCFFGPKSVTAEGTARVAQIRLDYLENNGTSVHNVTVKVEGIYGTFSPIRPITRAMLVKADPFNGCRPLLNIPKRPAGSDPFEPFEWIPLVLRSQDANCTFYDKLNNAVFSGASGVLIMNFELDKIVVMGGSASSTFPAIAISGRTGINFQNILQSAVNGTVWMTVEVGSEISMYHILFSKLFYDVAIFFMVFCVVTAFVLGGYYLQRRRYIREAEETRLKMSKKTEEFVQSLPTKIYHPPESKPETEEADSCAVCLEPFDEGETLRVVPCNHAFHVACIDPWLISKRTCPLCKYSIEKDMKTEENETEENGANGNNRDSSESDSENEVDDSDATQRGHRLSRRHSSRILSQVISVPHPSQAVETDSSTSTQIIMAPSATEVVIQVAPDQENFIRTASVSSASSETSVDNLREDVCLIKLARRGSTVA